MINTNDFGKGRWLDNNSKKLVGKPDRQWRVHTVQRTVIVNAQVEKNKKKRKKP